MKPYTALAIVCNESDKSYWPIAEATFGQQFVFGDVPLDESTFDAWDRNGFAEKWSVVDQSTFDTARKLLEEHNLRILTVPYIPAKYGMLIAPSRSLPKELSVLLGL